MAQVIPIPINPALFAVSLIDNNGNTAITTNADCTSLTITDKSNYTTNIDPGHAQGNFTLFRRILIEHYKGTIINLSSIGDGDVAILPASSGVNVFTQAVTTGDGRYDITLRSVPTWNAGVTQYQASDDCVYFAGNGKFYQCIQTNSNSQPDINPLDWKEILETDLPVKYNTKLFIALDCALLTCLNEKVDCAVCVMGDAFCDDNLLCSNKCFLAAAKLLMLYYGIQIDVQNQDEEKVDKKFDMVADICGCNSTNC